MKSMLRKVGGSLASFGVICASVGVDAVQRGKWSPWRSWGKREGVVRRGGSVGRNEMWEGYEIWGKCGVLCDVGEVYGVMRCGANVKAS